MARENGDAAKRVCGDFMTNAGDVLVADSVGGRVPARARAQVHSVFRRACNIETDAGALLTLLAPGCGNLPHGIRCLSPINARLRPGQPATLECAALSVPAAGLVVDLSRAAVWRGTVSAASPELRDSQAHGALGILRGTLRNHAPDRGVAPALFRSGDPRSVFERALRSRIVRSLPIIARATGAGDAGAVVSALRALLGLGGGLTPAGDDFIVGYLAALWSRSYREPGIAALLRALAGPVGQLSLRTNAISRQMLLDALEGHFAERLTEVVNCICRGGDVASAARRALEVGHSSGADVLCGLLFGFAPGLVAGPARIAAEDAYFGDVAAALPAANAC